MIISLEGGEGSGKSTQAKLMAAYFRKKGYKTKIVQEPGETQIGKKIRKLLLDPNQQNIKPITEVFLYMSARAQLVSEIIQPLLKKDYVIICDRYLDSSMAYQGYGRKLGFQIVGLLNQIAIQNHSPDLTFYFDMHPEKGLKRKFANRNIKIDRLERESIKFHSRIRQGYRQLAKIEPERIKSIPADLSKKDIWLKIELELNKYLSRKI